MLNSTRSKLVLAAFMVFASMPPGTAIAQTAENTEPISLGDLFTSEDSVDLTPDATALLQGAALLGEAAGNCLKGTITVVVTATDDPLFQEALARARLEIIELALGEHAVDWRLEVISDGFANEVKVEYGRSDQEPPRLDVVWTPPADSEVRAGDTITANITGVDDFDTFQTGIASISMTAGNDAPFGHDYPQPPQDCAAMTPGQQMESFYTVPDPAPAQVNMRATAKDFAGNETDLLAAFPARREPCASGVVWSGSISGVNKPHWGHKVIVTADSVRLCELEINPSLEYILVGQEYFIELINDGSQITEVHANAGDRCQFFGQGTSRMMREAGVISSVLESVGPEGALHWSEPTYWLSAATSGMHTYTEICPPTPDGNQTMTYDSFSSVNIGHDSADPLSGNRRLEGNVMAGGFANADGTTASWELTREGGEAALFPEVAP